VPIVFTQTPDPVGAGFVESLARPGGNATGFTNLEYGLSGKYLELLKEMVPNMKRTARRVPLSHAGVLRRLRARSSAPRPSPRIVMRPAPLSKTPAISRF
jgi:putative tryptophan/tyrosine transport system substrate-binding protein